MLNVDKYITKEGNRFFIDVEGWRNGLEVGIEEGDVIRFKYDDIKYMGRVVKFGSESDLFELINVREPCKI
jgi:hypothetical protein